MNSFITQTTHFHYSVDLIDKHLIFDLKLEHFESKSDCQFNSQFELKYLKNSTNTGNEYVTIGVIDQEMLKLH